MHQAARGLVHLVDGFVQQAQIGRVVQKARTAQQQVVVVTRETFKKPQLVGVVLAAVVELGKRRRFQAFDVPGVKVFVADEAQQRGVTLAAAFVAHTRQVAPGADQGGGVAVFQPAITVVHGIQHKHVVRVRRFATRVPEPDFRFANLLGIGQQPRPVKRGCRTGHHKAVGYTTGLELTAPEMAQLERVVYQRVVIVCHIAAKTACIGGHSGQARGDVPGGRGPGRDQLQRMGQGLLPCNLQAQAGAVKKPA